MCLFPHSNQNIVSYQAPLCNKPPNFQAFYLDQDPRQDPWVISLPPRSLAWPRQEISLDPSFYGNGVVGFQSTCIASKENAWAMNFDSCVRENNSCTYIMPSIFCRRHLYMPMFLFKFLELSVHFVPIFVSLGFLCVIFLFYIFCMNALVLFWRSCNLLGS